MKKDGYAESTIEATSRRLRMIAKVVSLNDPEAVKIGNSIRMTIPKQIADYLKIDEGDALEITIQDSEMVVKKA